jgi:hypothetical protein
MRHYWIVTVKSISWNSHQKVISRKKVKEKYQQNIDENKLNFFNIRGGLASCAITD